MSADPRHERIQELLCDRALVGLSAEEERELARLAGQSGAAAGAELDVSLDVAAAALDLALAPRAEPLSPALRRRLAAAAHRFDAFPGAPEPHPPRRSMLALSGWLVATAACVLAFFAWRARTPVPLDLRAVRAELLARADTLQREWSAQELARGASGDVVWSQALQQGVLRFQDLAPNDPTRAQYQLWIFDATQEHPIDGGVFDVAQGDAFKGDAGEVLVRIHAKLFVREPKLFAVTLEKPGGVVVSDQKRIALVAQL